MDLSFSAVTRPVERLMATAQNGLEVLRLGGLETGNSPSPSQTVESVPMYKLRRYFPPDSRPGHAHAGPPVLLVHPMMILLVSQRIHKQVHNLVTISFGLRHFHFHL